MQSFIRLMGVLFLLSSVSAPLFASTAASGVVEGAASEVVSGVTVAAATAAGGQERPVPLHSLHDLVAFEGVKGFGIDTYGGLGGKFVVVDNLNASGKGSLRWALEQSGKRVVVLIGPYEHHSNILPWRESGAEIRVIPEQMGGGLDMAALEAALTEADTADLVVGSFSAASNVTGLLTDVDAVTRRLKAHGALAIWDYAGGAPYLPMNMSPGSDCQKDAIVFSPHKFPGGPGSSGIAVIRDSVVRRDTPTAPGGGTVSFVSPWRHSYSSKVEAREEGGTPNVVGDIRAALVMLIKDAVGTQHILDTDAALWARAHARLSRHPNIRLLGQFDHVEALPIFSFQVVDTAGAPVHQQLFTRMLSDVFGVQVRGGCACAGP